MSTDGERTSGWTTVVEPFSLPRMLRVAFLSGPNEQVLLWGETADLAALSNGLRTRAAGVAHSSADCLPRQISLIIGEPAKGMSRHDDTFTWRIAPRNAIHFADLIDVLAQSEGAGHQYLDIDTLSDFGVEVKISKGEYPENFRGDDI